MNNVFRQVRNNISVGVLTKNTTKDLIDFLEGELNWLKANKEVVK